MEVTAADAEGAKRIAREILARFPSTERGTVNALEMTFCIMARVAIARYGHLRAQDWMSENLLNAVSEHLELCATQEE